MRYIVSSAWAGQYAKTKHGLTSSFARAAWWFLKFTVIEFFRVLKLNQYHYGNIFGVGKKRTDEYGRVL